MSTVRTHKIRRNQLAVPVVMLLFAAAPGWVQEAGSAGSAANEGSAAVSPAPGEVERGEEDPSGQPGWLLLAKGRRAFDEKDYGIALRYFRWAKSQRSVYPEADFWIGEVYRVEQELTLALEQYLRAYEDRNALRIPAQQYEILYQVADLYEALERYAAYEETLMRIVETVPRDEAALPVPLDQAMYRALVDHGPDKVLELYRVHNTGAMRARYRLGVFLYRTGRNAEGVRELLQSTMMCLTTVLNHLFAKDPEYVYGGVRRTLEDAQSHPSLVEYIVESDLFGQLYYLATALYAGGMSDLAEPLWEIVRDLGGDSEWADRSRRQIIDPFNEPLLDLTS